MIINETGCFKNVWFTKSIKDLLKFYDRINNDLITSWNKMCKLIFKKYLNVETIDKIIMAVTGFNKESKYCMNI